MDTDLPGTPPKITAIANQASTALLPVKSFTIYENTNLTTLLPSDSKGFDMWRIYAPVNR
ncbi:hypothetical protein PPYR_12269 [Photinus pyralis]|uniref:Uncharacterized protein n=1 Tax=Photinus pyralis TaxID=7054 RepID=A0A5N4ADM3_PHOPY|nr:hypothetical protein PPYR_12269 [Photinus pyralis]